MAQIKVSIGKMPVPKKIQFVRQIVQEMSSNEKFNAPSPALNTLSSAAVALEAAYNAAQAARANAKEQTSIMNNKINALETLVMQMDSGLVPTTDRSTLGARSFVLSVPFRTFSDVTAPCFSCGVPMLLRATA